MSATCKEKIQHDKIASSLVKLGLHLVMQFFLNRKQKRGRRPENAINCPPGNAKDWNALDNNSYQRSKFCGTFTRFLKQQQQ
jgi:hypothetical protein